MPCAAEGSRKKGKGGRRAIKSCYCVCQAHPILKSTFSEELIAVFLKRRVKFGSGEEPGMVRVLLPLPQEPGTVRVLLPLPREPGV